MMICTVEYGSLIILKWFHSLLTPYFQNAAYHYF